MIIFFFIIIILKGMKKKIPVKIQLNDPNSPSKNEETENDSRICQSVIDMPDIILPKDSEIVKTSNKNQ